MQDVQTVDQAEETRFYLLRSDTLLGVCQALGDALGFNPTLLRVSLCALLFWNPAAVIGTYAALGVVVVLIDWLYPKPADAAPAVQAEPEAAAANQAEPERELIAA